MWKSVGWGEVNPVYWWSGPDKSTCLIWWLYIQWFFSLESDTFQKFWWWGAPSTSLGMESITEILHLIMVGHHAKFSSCLEHGEPRYERIWGSGAPAFLRCGVIRLPRNLPVALAHCAIFGDCAAASPRVISSIKNFASLGYPFPEELGMAKI